MPDLAFGVSLRRSPASPGGSRRRSGARGDLAAVIVTYNALPYVERSLESVAGHHTVVVDHGSTDGTLDLVRKRFPYVRLVEQENLGLAAGWNRGIDETTAPFVVVLNADAWLVGNAAERLVSFAEEHERAGFVVPRLLNPDGSLQPSVRAFPTPWRLATEYLFLRKLAPNSAALNSFYGAGFKHDEVREIDFAKGAAFLLRRSAFDEIGSFDERFFLFSEETDWCYRLHQAGWASFFYPGAEAVHVGGASWRPESTTLFREQVRGHLRFLAKHRGQRTAERARRVLLAGLRLRALVFRGERGAVYRESAAWLAASPTSALL